MCSFLFAVSQDTAAAITASLDTYHDQASHLVPLLQVIASLVAVVKDQEVIASHSTQQTAAGVPAPPSPAMQGQPPGKEQGGEEEEEEEEEEEGKGKGKGAEERSTSLSAALSPYLTQLAAAVRDAHTARMESAAVDSDDDDDDDDGNGNGSGDGERDGAAQATPREGAEQYFRRRLAKKKLVEEARSRPIGRALQALEASVRAVGGDAVLDDEGSLCDSDDSDDSDDSEGNGRDDSEGGKVEQKDAGDGDGDGDGAASPAAGVWPHHGKNVAHSSMQDVVQNMFRTAQHFLSSPDERVVLTALDVLRDAAVALRGRPKSLHPMLHDVWSTFVKRLAPVVGNHLVVRLRAVRTCTTWAVQANAAEFLRRRFVADVWPALRLTLRRHCEWDAAPRLDTIVSPSSGGRSRRQQLSRSSGANASGNGNSNGNSSGTRNGGDNDHDDDGHDATGGHGAARAGRSVAGLSLHHQLHAEALVCLHDVCPHMDLSAAVVREMCGVVKPFLSARAPLALQEKGVALLRALLRPFPAVVWWFVGSLIAQDEHLHGVLARRGWRPPQPRRLLLPLGQAKWRAPQPSLRYNLQQVWADVCALQVEGVPTVKSAGGTDGDRAGAGAA